MFQLHITVSSIEEAERILACLRHDAAPAVVAQVGEQVNKVTYIEEGEALRAEIELATEKPKNPRGRPKREVAPPVDNAYVAEGCQKFEESAAPVVASESSEPVAPVGDDTPVPAQQTLTLDDAKKALMGVQARHGTADMAVPLQLLKEFGACRISEVKADDYPAFIAACEKA